MEGSAELVRATPEDWRQIRDIAYETWPHTFGKVIDAVQINAGVVVPDLSIQSKLKGGSAEMSTRPA